MAAHALTITHQLLETIAKWETPYWDYLEGALSPPGWDTAEQDTYSEFYQAVKARDIDRVKLALESAVKRLEPSHRHFRNMEDLLQAKWDFIRIHKPYWRARSRKWADGLAPLPKEDRAPFYSEHT